VQQWKSYVEARCDYEGNLSTAIWLHRTAVQPDRDTVALKAAANPNSPPPPALNALSEQQR